MPLEKLVFTVILGLVAVWLLDVTLRKRWDLPKEKKRIYYSTLHRQLFYGLMGVSLLATFAVSFMVSEGIFAWWIVVLPPLLSGSTTLVKAYMEWKHAENRYLFKATIVNTLGSAIILLLMLVTIFEEMGLPS